MDPVDGADPFGIVNEFITRPGELLPYEVPVLVVESGLGGMPKGGIPCAPEGLSNMRFYEAMRGPKWYVNVTGYGHVDFYDPLWRRAGSSACRTCKENCDFKAYRKLVKDLIVNFVKGILDKKPEKLKWIEEGHFDL